MLSRFSGSRTFGRLLITVPLGVCALLVFTGIRYWPRPVNVLILTLDTTRSDRVGCYGHPGAFTPNIDKLAGDGVLFERAYATVPLTLPSHASIFTGLYPPEHGLRVNGRDVLPSEPGTLAELLQRHGYSTAAFVSAFVLDKKFGLSRGFQQYQSVAGAGSADDNGTASGVTDAALRWLVQHSGSQFFCWVHYIDPHADYDSHPEVFGNQFAGSPYDGEIAYVDLHVGRILRFLKERGLDEHTMIIVVGDHGEAFGEHGERTHGTLVYNTTMQVPLIVRFPGAKFGDRKVSSPVSMVDVLPTVADFLGLKPRDNVSGKSLLKVIQKRPEPPRGIYFESLAMTPRGWAPQHAVVRDQWKFVRSPRSQLFDLITDPGENQNRLEEMPAITSEMSELLTLMQSGFRKRTGEGTQLTAQEMAKISAGGYAVGPQILRDAAAPDAPDVKVMLPFYYQTIDAEELLENSPRLAEMAVRKVVEDRPDFEMGWSVLGAALFRQGRLPEAVTALLRAYQIDPRSTRANETLGRIRRVQNQFVEAQTHLEEVVRARPDNVGVRIELAEVQLLSGKTDPAISNFKAAIEAAPDRFQSHLGLAEALLKKGDRATARLELELVLRLSPTSKRAREMLDALDKRS